MDPDTYGNQDCTSISFGVKSEPCANVPVKSSVLLRQANVTIMIGPRYLWNLAVGVENYQWCVVVQAQGGSPLDFSNPLASRPKYRSSIHHAISLTKVLAGVEGVEVAYYPTLKLFDRGFVLNAGS